MGRVLKYPGSKWNIAGKLKGFGVWPYVMIYGKERTRPSDTVRRVQRWVNMRAVFEKVGKFEDYK